MKYNLKGYDIDLEQTDVVFASDFHFGHNQPFIYKNRGFNSIEEHDDHIYNQLYEYTDLLDDIPKSLSLIYLGDFAWNETAFKLRFEQMSELFDTIYYIFGNHDKLVQRVLERHNIAYIPSNYKNINFMGQLATFNFKNGNEHLIKFLCSHYPMIDIPGCFRGGKMQIYNVHGHVHGNKMKYEPVHCVDVSVDACSNKCFMTFDEVMDNIDSKYKSKKIDPSERCCKNCINYFGDDALVPCKACSSNELESFQSIEDYAKEQYTKQYKEQLRRTNPIVDPRRKIIKQIEDGLAAEQGIFR